MNVKQVIVVRKDLNMRKGKIAAQVAHGSMAFLTRGGLDDIYGIKHKNEMRFATDWMKVSFAKEVKEWLENSFKKVVVYVDSEDEIWEIDKRARKANLVSHIVTDRGLTEFNGVTTLTCVAIGPHEVSKFEGVTDGLPLL